ncbi:MAG TPA: ABC transporter permease [Anaerolineaceae bacterium]
MAEQKGVSRSEPRIVYLKPPSGWAALRLSDLWLYRELVFFMTWRDLKVRYKQTLLGASWAVLRPFLSMVVFSIFFGGFAKVSSDGVPYPLFSFAGLLPWELFATALGVGARSLVNNSNMITKVYFPRLILPLSSILAAVVDFVIAFAVMMGMMLYYRWPVSPYFWTLPLFLLLALVSALGVSLWLSALNVQYRDIGYITPFLTQFWLFVSPVVYPLSMITNPTLRYLMALNPMTGVIEGFRWALLGASQQQAPGLLLVVSSAVAVVLLVTGLFYFHRMERLFADMI